MKAKFDDFNSELEYDDTIVSSNTRDFKSIFLKVFPYVIATLNVSFQLLMIIHVIEFH